jgi:hypothetical protein
MVFVTFMVYLLYVHKDEVAEKTGIKFCIGCICKVNIKYWISISK